MIEPIKGYYYKIKYIGGNIYSNQIIETDGLFIRKSINNKYLFAIDYKDEKRYFIICIERENIIENIIKKDICFADQIDVYIVNSHSFFTTSINSQTHIGYIEYDKINDFLCEYYKPETGEGYLDALSKWQHDTKR